LIDSVNCNIAMAVLGIKMKLMQATKSKNGVDWLRVFKAYDKDGSGQIDLAEFKQVIRHGAKVAAREVSDDALLTLFRSVDKDASGTISYESEFLPWLEAVTKPRADIDRGTEETIRRNLRAAAYEHGGINWKKLFSYYDRDNTGEIDYEELRRAIRKDAKIKETELHEEDLKTLFKFIDQNNDGFIQYDPEFIDWIDPSHLTRAKYTRERAKSLPTKTRRQVAALKARSTLPAKALKDIKKRLKSFATYNGQVNWQKLFEYYDPERTGQIEYDKFRVAIRQDAKIGSDKLSEFKLRALFKHIDKDHSGKIEYATEFCSWIAEDDNALSFNQDDLLHADHEEDPEILAEIRTRQLEEMLLLGKVKRSFTRAKMLLPFVVKWINHILEVEAVTLDNFEEELRDGLILCRLLIEMGSCSKRSTQGLNVRPVGRAMCISNLDLGLGIAFRFGVNVANFCRPEDFYEMNRMKVARCMLEIFDSMQMRKLRRKMPGMLREMNALLDAMGRPMMEKTLAVPLNDMHFLTDFEDGIRLMAVLVACKEATLEQMAEMYGMPDAAQLIENAGILNAALAKARFPRFLSDRDWSHPPCWDIDPCILQLSEVWDRLREAGQAVVPDFSKFEFKDGVKMEIKKKDLADAEKRAQGALKRNVEAAPPVPHYAGGARLFAIHVLKMGPIGEVWLNFDKTGNGFIGMTGFLDGARKIGFKGNAKAIYQMIDCNKSGHIERHEMEHFCDMVLVPHTVHEIEQIQVLAISHPAFWKYLQLC